VLYQLSYPPKRTRIRTWDNPISSGSNPPVATRNSQFKPPFSDLIFNSTPEGFTCQPPNPRFFLN